MSERIATIHLHKDHERRLLLGHPWVFSNEVAGDLRQYEPGSLVDVGVRVVDFVEGDDDGEFLVGEGVYHSFDGLVRPVL